MCLFFNQRIKLSPRNQFLHHEENSKNLEDFFPRSSEVYFSSEFLFTRF